MRVAFPESLAYRSASSQRGDDTGASSTFAIFLRASEQTSYRTPDIHARQPWTSSRPLVPEDAPRVNVHREWVEGHAVNGRPVVDLHIASGPKLPACVHEIVAVLDVAAHSLVERRPRPVWVRPRILAVHPLVL